MEKHAGQILEKAIRKSDVSIAEVSRRLKVTRRTLYYWFNKKAINASIITNIGMAINHDFSEDYPQFLNHINTSSEQTTDEETAWRNKYIDVLEQYNNLLQQKHWV